MSMSKRGRQNHTDGKPTGGCRWRWMGQPAIRCNIWIFAGRPTTWPVVVSRAQDGTVLEARMPLSHPPPRSFPGSDHHWVVYRVTVAFWLFDVSCPLVVCLKAGDGRVLVVLVTRSERRPRKPPASGRPLST
jgi:hypothetical protein